MSFLFTENKFINAMHASLTENLQDGTILPFLSVVPGP